MDEYEFNDELAEVTTPVDQTEQRVAFVQALRELADWIETAEAPVPRWDVAITLNPSDFMPYIPHYRPNGETRADGEATELRHAQAVAAIRLGGEKLRVGADIGDVEKITGYFFGVKRTFGGDDDNPGIRIEVEDYSDNTCTRVPTGETTTSVRYEIPEEVRQQYRVETEVPVYRSECPPLIERSDAG